MSMLGSKLLHGDRVYLAAAKDAYVDEWAAHFSNFDFAYLADFHIRVRNAEEERKRFKEGKSGGMFLFAIHLTATDASIGVCSLSAPDWKNRSSMLGISIFSPQHWGHGLGAEATDVLLRYGFWELNLHRIELGVFEYNARAVHAYEKLGFVHEGRRRQMLYRDGKFHDVIHMSILAPEWNQRHAGDA